MKKQQIKPRNPMGIHVHNRKAGKHMKPFKSLRKIEKTLFKKSLNKNND